MLPITVFELFDIYLAERSLECECTIIGGAALAANGVLTRYTRDVDVLSPILLPEIIEAADAFARKHCSRLNLVPGWFKNGHQVLHKHLHPEELNTHHLEPVFIGNALVVFTAPRSVLIKTKLWAMCDREFDDLPDLLALQPSDQELDDEFLWVCDMDAHPDWPNHVGTCMQRLQEARHGA